MTDKKSHTELTGSDRFSVFFFAICFCLYVLNVLIGKANIVYELNIFHFGNVGEFLILFTASIAFIVAALHQEAVCISNRKSSKE